MNQMEIDLEAWDIHRGVKENMIDIVRSLIERGDDIDAACGQLAGDVIDRTRLTQRAAERKTILLKEVRI